MGRGDLALAIEAGATLSTHLGNGAHDMIQRHNNYIWYQLAARETFAAFISDGQHLPREALYCMLHAKGLDHSLITSDCVSLGGLPAGVYGAVEKMPSGRLVATGTTNLSGSSSNLRECTESVIKMAGVTHAEAWRLASTQPARAMHLEHRLGLEPGKEASLTVYRYQETGPGIEVLQTWVAGRKVFDADLMERTAIRTAFLGDMI
jgi:N-acetylglucosamine-6-phosphate deacetylase